LSKPRRSGRLLDAKIKPIAALALLSASCGDRHPRVDIEPGVFSGVRLTTKLPRLVRRACGQAQREAVIRVVCPPLVPKVPLVRTVALWGAIGFDRHLWMITFNNGDGPDYLHWIAGAGRPSGSPGAVRRSVSSCSSSDTRALSASISRARSWRQRAAARSQVTSRLFRLRGDGAAPAAPAGAATEAGSYGPTSA
jgi:hypothetical protein